MTEETQAERQQRFHQMDEEFGNPMTALADSLGLERRSLDNHPRRLFRLVMFALPFLVLVFVAPLVIPRDIALTVASAMLGVQLAVPYAAWVRRVAKFVDESRENDQHPLRYIAEYGRDYLLNDRALVWYGLSAHGNGIMMNRGGRRGANRTLSRLKFRFHLEPAWRRHFGDVSMRMSWQETPDPASIAHFQYSDDRWNRIRLLLVLRYFLAVRTLEAVGREVRLVTLKADSDLPARNLAAQLGLPYAFHPRLSSRVKHQVRLLRLLLLATGKDPRPGEDTQPSEQQEQHESP